MNDNKVFCDSQKLSTIMNILNLQPKDIAQKFGIRVGDIYHLRSEKSKRLKPLHVYALMAAYQLPAKLFSDEVQSQQEMEKIIKERDRYKTQHKSQESTQWSKNIEKIAGEWFVYENTYNKSDFTVRECKMTITLNGTACFYHLHSNVYVFEGNLVEKNGKFLITLDKKQSENRAYMQLSIDTINDRFPALFLGRTFPLGLDIAEVVIFSKKPLTGYEQRIETIVSRNLVIDKNIIDSVYWLGQTNHSSVQYYAYNYTSGNFEHQKIYWERTITIHHRTIECHLEDTISFYGNQISQNEEDLVYHLIEKNTQQNCYLILRTKELNTKAIFVGILVNYRLIDNNDRVVKTILFSKNKLDESQIEYLLGSQQQSVIHIEQSHLNRKIFQIQNTVLETMQRDYYLYSWGSELAPNGQERHLWEKLLRIQNDQIECFVQEKSTHRGTLISLNNEESLIYLVDNLIKESWMIFIRNANLEQEFFVAPYIDKFYKKSHGKMVGYHLFSKTKLSIQNAKTILGKPTKSQLLTSNDEFYKKAIEILNSY